MTKRHTKKEIGKLTYITIYCMTKHYWGSELIWVSRQDQVAISDIERTILDGLDRPEYCGGIKEVVRGIWSKRNSINWQRMLEYARQYRTHAAVKRLGVIVELLELGDDQLEALHSTTLQTNSHILLNPFGDNIGPKDNKWKVKINMNIDELKEGLWA
jgi:predicted transcriptional regulator of viral defense system